MRYKCNNCQEEIKPIGKKLRVYSQGLLFCGKECLHDFYDINFIHSDFIPEVLDPDLFLNQGNIIEDTELRALNENNKV